MPLPTHSDDALWAMKMIDSALDKGWSISVNDGEDWTLRKSRDRDAIIEELASTDENLLGFWDSQIHVGNAYIIWGEPDGDGVFTDCSGTKAFNIWHDALCDAFNDWLEQRVV